MFGLIHKIKGKFAYLNRKMALYKWMQQNDSDNITINEPCDYLELHKISDIDKMGFSFDFSEYKDRFSKGHVFCGLTDTNGCLMAYGWLNGSVEHYLGELNLNMIITKNSSMLYDFKTFEAFRGKGLYPYLLHRICARDDKSKLIYAFPENKQSSKGILKANFKFLGTISGFTKNKYTKMIKQ